MQYENEYIAWTIAEIEHLYTYYPYAEKESLAAEMGRSPKSLTRKASNMGITRERKRDWAPEEERALKALYDVMTKREISVILKRTERSIDYKVTAMRLSKTPDPFDLSWPTPQKRLACEQSTNWPKREAAL